MWSFAKQKKLEEALIEIRELKASFEKDLRITGDNTLNSELEKAGRIADYIELAELMCYDALQREESCGAHFREEYQTADGEAVRNDKEFCYVSAWEWKGLNNEPELHKEPLTFESVELAVRSYK